MTVTVRSTDVISELLLVLLHFTSDEVADFVSHLLGLSGHLMLPEKLPAGLSGGSLTAVNITLKIQLNYLHLVFAKVDPFAWGRGGGALPEAFHYFISLYRFFGRFCVGIITLLSLSRMRHHDGHCVSLVLMATLCN